MAAERGGWFGRAFGLRLLLATVLQTVSAFRAEFSSEACRELGFSSNLLCSSCDLLGQFNLLQLDPDCRGCCQEEAQFETKKEKYLKFLGWKLAEGDLDQIYRFAVYMQELFLKSVDENWDGSLKSKFTFSRKAFGRYFDYYEMPIFRNKLFEVRRAFVRSDKPKLFRGLQIKYVRGSDPVLKLLDDNGNIAEELSILKWNTDSVEEFLSEKLERI